MFLNAKVNPDQNCHGAVTRQHIQKFAQTKNNSNS